MIPEKLISMPTPWVVIQNFEKVGGLENEVLKESMKLN